MNLSEIEKLENFETLEDIKNFLSDKKVELQAAKGFCDIKIKASDGQEYIVKSFPLSKHFCAIGGSNLKIEPFKSFAGRVTITHIPTGMNIKRGKISKVDAIRLCSELETLLDWNFIKLDNVDRSKLCEAREIVQKAFNHEAG